eukprot:CAMPEP_0168525630 /NCGR_PEP_ID=MMETSP0405-20121227/11428_1 /TAXON_ID=498012 /ORGANISM="Trichosphaerium sp, Strain Am-I-7 wt" /LENGTH=144 /DNA_ID=CAMNT_0008548201 /DNA_START=415 /DNA_END=846 /DNA_ORIENTATION=-
MGPQPNCTSNGTCTIEGDYIIDEDISFVGNTLITIIGDLSWRSGNTLTLEYSSILNVSGCIDLTDASIKVVLTDNNVPVSTPETPLIQASCAINTTGLMVDFDTIFECRSQSLDTTKSGVGQIFVAFTDTCLGDYSDNNNGLKY